MSEGAVGVRDKEAFRQEMEERFQRRRLEAMRRGATIDFPIFASDGDYSHYGHCGTFSHNYWRIPESPYGICLNCGHIAQDVESKLRYIHRKKETLQKLRDHGDCHMCKVELGLKHLRSHKEIRDGTILCTSHCLREYLRSIKPLPDGTSEPPPVPWSFGNLKLFVLERDHHTCLECGTKETQRQHGSWMGGAGVVHKMHRTNLEVHHILPKAEGGSDHPANMKTLCHDCHNKCTKSLYRIKKSVRLGCAKMEDFLTVDG